MELCQLSFPRHRRPDRPRTSRVAALYGSARRVFYLDVCSRPCALVQSMSTNVSTPCAVSFTKSTRQRDSLLSSPGGKLSCGRGKFLSVDARCLFTDRCVHYLSSCIWRIVSPQYSTPSFSRIRQRIQTVPTDRSCRACATPQQRIKRVGAHDKKSPHLLHGICPACTGSHLPGSASWVSTNMPESA